MKFSVITTLKSRIGHVEWLLVFVITKSIIQSQPESIVEINGWKFPAEARSIFSWEKKKYISLKIFTILQNSLIG